MAGQSRFSMSATISLIDKVTAPMGYALKSIDNFSDKVRGRFGSATKSSNTFGTSVGNIVKGVIGANLLSRGLSFVASGFKKIVYEAAEYEKTFANFTTLLGGNEAAAKSLINKLQLLGAETPFEFADLAKSTQMLFGFGVATEKNIVPTLRMLGDLAQGDALKLGNITRNFGQVMARGRMMGADFNQFVDAGVPVAIGLAKVWGVDVDQAMLRIQKNPVTSGDLLKAFQQMTAEGGLFYQGMLRSSKTLPGLWSTFNDALSMTASAIGQELLPYLKEMVISATEVATSVLAWVQANKDLIGGRLKTIGSVISFVAKTIWFLRYVILAAVVAYTAFKIIVAASSIPLLINTALIWGAQAAIWAITAAQWLWNIAMGANPIGLIIIGIAALIAAGILLYQNWDTVKKFFVDFWNRWQGLITLAMLPLWPFIKMAKIIMDNWQPLKDFFISLWGYIIQGVDFIMPYIDKLMNAVNFVGNVIGSVAGFMGGAAMGGLNAAESGARTLTGQGVPGSPSSPNNRGTNSTTTNNTNGVIDFNVNGGSSAGSISQSGTFPYGFSLNSGKDKPKG